MTDHNHGQGDLFGGPGEPPEVAVPPEGGPLPGPGWSARLEALRIPVMIALALVAAFATVQFLRGGDDATTDQVAPPPPEVAPTVAVTSLPSVAPAATTTAPPSTTAAPPATTIPPTTTTTTTTTITPPPFIEPIGDPIAIDDLVLSVVGIGPLDFGDSGDQVLGRIAASLGQPGADTGRVDFGPSDRCEAGTRREVRWGPLTIVTEFDQDGGERFHSFRVDVRDPAVTGPASGLQTLSGLKAGDTVGELQDIYGSGFTIDYTQHEAEGDRFELRSRQGLLLWGPVTSTERDGTVLGIFSTDAC
jgi:hypothetical protein